MRPGARLLSGEDRRGPLARHFLDLAFRHGTLVEAERARRCSGTDRGYAATQTVPRSVRTSATRVR
jgi:hypothetical protein